MFFDNKCEFNVNWITTGTPEFIVKLLRANPKFNIDEELARPRADFFTSNSLSNLGIKGINIINLLYQSGYITVVGFDEDGYYLLGYPNKEVKVSFIQYLAKVYLGLKSDDNLTLYSKVSVYLIKNDIKSFIDEIDHFFRSQPYPSFDHRECSYQTVISAFIVAGDKRLDLRSEDIGPYERADLVVITEKYIYIIELKLDKNASTGMKQIKEKQYFYKYLHDKNYEDKSIILISISFDSYTHGIKDYMVETVR